MKKYIIIYSILFGFIACKNVAPDEQDAEMVEDPTQVTLTDNQLKNAGLETGKIELRSISSLLKVNGKIEVPPQNMVSISVPMGGYLKSSKLLEGMHINKGEIIATMEDQQYIQLQEDYLTAKIHFTGIEAEYLRQRTLNQSKASSDKIFQQAETEYLAQKITIRSLEEKLKLIGINPEKLSETTISKSIQITSPIDGYVSQVNMNVGKYVQPQDVLFELVNPTDIHLSLTIFEKDLSKISIGQKIFAYTNNNRDKIYNCEIILIGKDVSPERTIQVQCHFENYDKSLIPGMYMNAEVEVATNNAYVIPDEGLVRFEGKQYVYIASANNVFDMIPVNTFNNENGYTQIVFEDDLDAADKIFVLKGAYTLLMKMKNSEEEE